MENYDKCALSSWEDYRTLHALLAANTFSINGCILISQEDYIINLHQNFFIDTLHGLPESMELSWNDLQVIFNQTMRIKRALTPEEVAPLILRERIEYANFSDS